MVHLEKTGVDSVGLEEVDVRQAIRIVGHVPKHLNVEVVFVLQSRTSDGLVGSFAAKRLQDLTICSDGLSLFGQSVQLEEDVLVEAPENHDLLLGLDINHSLETLFQDSVGLSLQLGL